MLTASPFNDTDVSAQAARSITPSAQALREQILAYIAAQPNGATCDEIELALGMKHQTASARLHELHYRTHQAWKEDGVTRETRSGRQAHIYTIANAWQAATLAEWYPGTD